MVERAATHGAATALEEEAALRIGVDWLPVAACRGAHRLQQLAQQPLIALAEEEPEELAWRPFGLARALLALRTSVSWRAWWR